MNDKISLIKLKEKKESFSLHSLINQYGLSLEEAKNICNIAQKDPEITLFYFIKCPKCMGQNSSGIFDKYVVGASKKCFHCGHRYKTKIGNIEFVFDPSSLLDKLPQETKN